MNHLNILCRIAIALGAFLLAAPAGAAPAPTSKPPVVRRPRPAHQVKGPAACCATAAPATRAAQAPPLADTPAAPQVVQLKGIVLGANGRPCAGASVYPAGAPRQLVVTDAQGAFTLPVPAGEAVSLRVEYFGEGSSRVEVPASGTEPLRITLGK